MQFFSQQFSLSPFALSGEFRWVFLSGLRQALESFAVGLDLPLCSQCVIAAEALFALPSLFLTVGWRPVKGGNPWLRSEIGSHGGRASVLALLSVDKVLCRHNKIQLLLSAVNPSNFGNTSQNTFQICSLRLRVSEEVNESKGSLALAERWLRGVSSAKFGSILQRYFWRGSALCSALRAASNLRKKGMKRTAKGLRKNALERRANYIG